MKRTRKGVARCLLVLASLAALFFLLSYPSEPSDPEKIDALASAEIIADGFREPTGIVAAQSGEVFVSDRKDGKVFKITGGNVETLKTHLRDPAGLAFDADGRLLIVEEKSGQLLRFEDGRLTILAEGMKKPRWVAVAEGGMVYISAKGLRSRRDKKDDDEDNDDDEEQVILRLAPEGGITVFVEGFQKVEGLVVHEGTLFAAARGHNNTEDRGGVFQIPIRAGSSAGPITRITHERIKKPVGLARDRLGALYVSAEEFTEGKKKSKDAIGKITLAGVLSRFAAKLQKPRGLAFDSSGNLYVADDRGDKKGRLIRFGAPPAPALIFPSFTNQGRLTIHGKTEPESRIDTFLNDSTSPITLTTPDGSFDLRLDLRLNAENSLDVSATAHNGLRLTSAAAELTIVHDNMPPLINGLSPPGGSFLKNRTPPIGATFSDNLSGVDTSKVVVQLDSSLVSAQALVTPSGFTLPFHRSLNPLSEGNHTIFVSLSDRAGNSTSASWAFTVDVTAPSIVNLTPADGSVVNTDRPLIQGGFIDNSGIDLASVKIFLDGSDVTSLAAVTASGFSLDPSKPLTLQPFNLSQGPHAVAVSIEDLAGNSGTASSTFTVTTGPEITAFYPGSGAVGSEVTIQGRGFELAPGNTSVRFSGVRATITGITQTTIRAIVPIGATTGRITVETGTGTGMSSEDFIVLLRQDFALSVSPEVGSTVQGMSTTHAVRVTSRGLEPFTGLAALSVSGLPAGVSASIAPSTLSSRTTGILTLTTSSSAAVGSSTVEVRATSQIEGRVITRTAQVTLAVQAPGQTVLIGQVRDENERPLAGVSIKQGGATLTDLGMTDAGGNFFIPLSITGSQVFLIDGSTANTPTVTYSTIPVTVDIQLGAVNTLGFTPRLHGQAVAKLTPIIPGQAAVVTHPDVPGFTMTIPSGVQIIGWDRQPNNQFSVTVVPIDRSPLPPPPPGVNARVIYLFSFGKVGGGIPTGNIPIDSPNDIGGLPGDKVDLYYFNEAPDGTAPNRWEKYGTATVSSDGARIITDINPATSLPYGFPRFCCGAFLREPRASPTAGGGASGGQSGSGATDGEPVDTATGFFYLDKTDLVLPGIVPIAITRTYRTNLTNAGPFGLGTSWPYDIFLQPPPNSSPDALILFTPGNRQDLFSRQTDGSFVNTTSPPLRGAVVTVAGGFRSLRFKDGALWRFDSAGRLVSQADRNGNTLTLIRDGQARVIGIAEPSGRQLTVSYASPALRIDAIRDPVGREVRYAYDGFGRLTSVTDPAGGITRYTYDGSNRMVTITDPRGITFLTNDYDGAGRVIRQTQADGGVWTFAYTTSGSFISQTTVTDPRDNSTTYRFNSSGFLISQTDALGQTTTMERQAGTNLLLSTTDPLGRRTSFTYDANGNVASITDPAGNIRTFTYEPVFNKVTTIADPLGNVTAFEYDARGNLITTVDPLGNRTTIAYNSFGQLVSTTDPLGNITTFTYDDFGNLMTIGDPLGNKTQRTYDLVSRLIEQTDPRGRSARFTYDGLNRITQIVDTLSGITGFTYDGNGNLLTVTDTKSQTTRYSYDVMDRLSTRTDPLSRVEAYLYDPAGNLTQFTDRKGQVATFTYDDLNRRTQASYADGSRVESTYDAVGRLLRTSDTASGAIEFSYDNLDRLTQEITAQGVVRYSYDVLGRRTSMTANGQAPINYSYDAASRLTQVAQGSQTVGLSYDLAGRRTSLSYPNATNTAYTYDPASRLTRILHQGPTSIIEDLTYTYDAAGNRISFGRSGPHAALPQPVQAAYDAANQQIQFNSVGPNLTYDANGNLSSQTDATGTTFHTWDARSRLVGISGPNLAASFAYDALGRRISKTINGEKTTYQYDGNDIIAEVVGGVVAATYLRSLNIDEPFIRQSVSPEFYHTDALRSAIALTDDRGAIQTTYTYDPFGYTQSLGQATTNPFQYTGRENDGTGLYYYRSRYYAAKENRFIADDIWDIAFTRVWMRRQFLLLGAGSSTFAVPFGDVIRQAFLVNPSLTNQYAYAANNPLRFSDPLGLFYIDVGVNIPVFGPFGGISVDVQIQTDSLLNLENLNLVPGVYIGTPGVQVLGVTGDPVAGPQSTLSGGYWLGGSMTYCGPNLCSVGLGFSTPGAAVEIIQYGISLYKRK